MAAEVEDQFIIVGGGLSGLHLAYQLSQINISATILEASPRLGGRIQTTTGAKGTPLELGATWFSDLHQNVLQLVDELNLSKYPQYSKGISLFETKSFEPPQEFKIPESEKPSYRIAGGTQKLTDTLSKKLNKDQIRLNTKVSSINSSDGLLEVMTTKGRIFRAQKVILCIPPELASIIKFKPELPQELNSILPEVHTWMSGSVKFVIEYKQPFWRKNGYSGMLFSHAGIVMEMYDHTNIEETKFGFTGFLNGESAKYSKQTRKELVLQHLNKLLGEEASTPTFYNDKIWSDELITTGSQNIQRPHQNNGHPLLKKTYLNGRLFFCNTETASEFSGYMEGAIRSSKRLLESFK